jgi:hypothetical protein
VRGELLAGHMERDVRARPLLQELAQVPVQVGGTATQRLGGDRDPWPSPQYSAPPVLL